MRLNFSDERVLAVVAHPDDAELLCAGTLARARADGAQVGICVLCQGDRGQPAVPIEDLAAVRRREMEAAAKLLGAQLLRGEFPDGELLDSPPARKKIVELYRQFRPTLVLAHSRGDYHCDHQAASALAEAVSWLSASTGQVTEAPALETPPSLWWMDTVNMAGFLPEFSIDVSEQMELKRQMLRCHSSQLQRGSDSAFSPLEELMEWQSRTRGIQSGARAAEAFRSLVAWKRTRAW